jgi:protein-disulfide isomerase
MKECVGNKGICCKVAVVASVVAVGIATLSYYRPRKTEGTQDSMLENRIRAIATDVIKENPQMLMDVMGEGMARKREEAIKQLADDVFAQKNDIAKQCMKFGKAGAKNAFICFFDPICKHCVEFQKSMIKMIEAKKDVAFSMLPVAALGEDSLLLGRIYAVIYDKDPVKALAFIKEITSAEAFDKEEIEKALKKIDLTLKDVEKQMPDGDRVLGANGALAEKLKIPTVPAIFHIRDSNAHMIQVVDYEELVKVIEE